MRVGRYGGEEFVILVQTPTYHDLELLSERIRQNIEAAEVLHDGKPVRATMSLGAALMDISRMQNRGDLPKQLIASADEAMYDAKSNGRNQVKLVRLPSQTLGDVLMQRKQPIEQINDPAVESFLKTVDSVLTEPTT